MHGFGALLTQNPKIEFLFLFMLFLSLDKCFELFTMHYYLCLLGGAIV